MISRSLCTAAVLFLLAAAPVLSADVYKSDPVHSSIAFSVRHMVISNVKGTFDKFDVTIAYDGEDITASSVDVTIDAASINTRHEKRDVDLRSVNFLHVEKYPLITFKSTALRRSGEGYVATGELTVRGVTKKVEFPFVVNGPVLSPWGQTVIGVEIHYALNRHDFGVSWNKTLDNGGVVVGDDVKVEIQVEAIREEQGQ